MFLVPCNGWKIHEETLTVTNRQLEHGQSFSLMKFSDPSALGPKPASGQKAVALCRSAPDKNLVGFKRKS